MAKENADILLKQAEEEAQAEAEAAGVSTFTDEAQAKIDELKANAKAAQFEVVDAGLQLPKMLEVVFLVF